MPPKSKQKQSQKQEQNVKVVINQNDNKKRSAKRTRSNKKQTTPQPQGPVPYGISPQQRMRMYQTYTPQVNNNAAVDFSSIVNALRANMAMGMAVPVPQGPQPIINRAVQPVPVPVRQPVRAPSPPRVPSTPATQNPVPQTPAQQTPVRPSVSVIDLTNDVAPLRPPLSNPTYVPSRDLASLLKTPQKLQGSYEFPDLNRFTALTQYKPPVPELRASLVFDDNPPITNVPLSQLKPIEPNAQKLREGLSPGTNKPQPKRGKADKTAKRVEFDVTIAKPDDDEDMLAGMDFRPDPSEIMGAKTNKDVVTAQALEGVRLNKRGLPDKRFREVKNAAVGVPLQQILP